MVAVRVELHVEGALAGRAVLAHHREALLHGEHVHAVDPDTGDGAAAHGVIVVVAGVARGGGAHAVVVVLGHKHHGQVPQLGHVRGLPDLALVGGAVTVAGHGDGGLLSLGGGVLGGEGQASTHRGLRADDALAAVEVGGLAVEVHRASLALGGAVGEAQQLGEDLLDGGASQQGGAVAAVGGDPTVLHRHGSVHARGDGLLAVVQVAETADVSGLGEEEEEEEEEDGAE